MRLVEAETTTTVGVAARRLFIRARRCCLLGSSLPFLIARRVMKLEHP